MFDDIVIIMHNVDIQYTFSNFRLKNFYIEFDSFKLTWTALKKKQVSIMGFPLISVDISFP